jgi:hypothetical protein
VCVRESHHLAGRAVRDGLGVSTIHDGVWAYCASARADESHEWQAIDPTPIQSIRHGQTWKVAPPLGTASPETHKTP